MQKRVATDKEDEQMEAKAVREDVGGEDVAREVELLKVEWIEKGMRQITIHSDSVPSGAHAMGGNSPAGK